MDRIRLWPHAIIIIAAVVVAGALGVFLWRRYEPSASANTLPNPVRIERVDGQAGLNRSSDKTDANSSSQWVEATANAPVSVGDRLYTRENSHLQIAFTGRNFAVLAPNTSLDVLDLSDGRTQVALRDGSALFDVGALASGQLFEVATPCGAVDLQDRGTYRLTVQNGGNATATAFSGQAQVVGQAGSGTINKGEVLTVPCNGGAGTAGTISRVDNDEAGSYLDNYYRYRYPKTYDGRYRNYYTYLNDPYYYDPSQRYTSYNYVSEDIPGLNDLDDYGDWQYVNNYGYCWHPRVDSGWAPYESGAWSMDYPYGLTWISTEPWGYAPYHYGRWAYASNEWFWVPEARYSRPSYAPALTAYIPLGNSSFAWVALGPSDPYVPYYYDQSWQPVYGRSYPNVTRLVNINAPNAVVVVPAEDFGRVIDPRIVRHLDPQTVARYQPVLDPLRVQPLRQAAFATRQQERRFDIPQVVTQQIINRPVMTTAAPVVPRFRRDLTNDLRVQTISDRARRQNLPLNDQRAAARQNAAPQIAGQAPNLAADQAREKQMADLARQAARGDRNARQQMQQLRQQQISEQRTARGANVSAQGERVGQQMRPQTELPRIDQRALRQQQQVQRASARQQTINSQQQQRAAQQQPIQTQRELRQIQRAQVRATRNAPQSQQMPRPQTQQRVRPQPQVRNAPQPQAIRPQRQQQRARPPAQNQPQAQPRVMAAPRSEPMREQPRAQPRQESRPQIQSRPQVQAQPRAQAVRSQPGAPGQRTA